MCYPMPVFIIGTYNADGTPNAMNAAWGGISEEAEISTAQQGHRRQASSVYSQYPLTPGLTPQQTQQPHDQNPNMSRYQSNTQASIAFQDKVRNYEATVEISPPSSPEMSPIHVPQLTGPTTSMSFMPSSPPLRMQVPVTQ